jgi:hypothetical protein
MENLKQDNSNMKTQNLLKVSDYWNLPMVSTFVDLPKWNKKTKEEESQRLGYVIKADFNGSFLNGDQVLTVMVDKKDYLTITFNRLSVSYSINAKNADMLPHNKELSETFYKLRNKILDYQIDDTVDQRLLVLLSILPNVPFTDIEGKEKLETIGVDTFVNCVVAIGNRLSELNINHQSFFSILFNFCLSKLPPAIDPILSKIKAIKKGQKNVGNYQVTVDELSNFLGQEVIKKDNGKFTLNGKEYDTLTSLIQSLSI